MDPAIATAAVALLAPYLARAGEAFAGKAGAAAWATAEQIYRAIRRKLAADPDPLTRTPYSALQYDLPTRVDRMNSQHSWP
jgi:hypothetical protein